MEDKIIVITGGTSGIGYEVTKLLHNKNKLIVISKNLDKLDRLSKELKGIVTYQADLSNPEEVEVVANAILDNFSSIDVLINNAAVQYTPTFLDDQFDYNNISKEININFTSICCLTYKLLPLLFQSAETIILNVNSGLALAPKTTSAIYCATKGALNIFTQSLRYQLEETNVSVQQVFLDLVDTDMTKGRGENKRSAH
ncbi:MAG: SDR family NAD(P)-dependent oxidoreductase, partial [Proteobacteria bacterium]|nr:SDR family NAD(P)-dependent oxidoreductase [Pseudomonadota bacterium]